VITLRTHNEAVADLQKIRALDEPAFFQLIALLQQIRADPRIFSQLLSHGHGKNRTADFNVSRWVTLSLPNMAPVWRLRAYDLEDLGYNYRIIYLFDWRDQTYNILGVIDKADIDYDDPNHPFRKRIAECIKRNFGGT
jgi:mRNA-degrading endonuclease RelE of RelBE toxin-antitoxin system